MKRVAMATLWLLVAANSAHAQLGARFTNPQIPVKLEHPPGLALDFTRAAFAPATGECADEFVQLLLEDFRRNEVDVVDRHNLQTLLAEHDFGASVYANPEAIPRLGEILGPSVLIFVQMHRCTTEQRQLYQRGRKYTTYISRTTAYVKGSVQVVDLATSRIFAAKSIDRTLPKENRSREGYAEFPSTYDTLDQALRQGLWDIHKLFFPWSETKRLYFFNDDKCGLKQAYLRLKVGDKEGALRESIANLDNCEGADVKPKTRAHALYNVGMGHFMLGEHDRALEFLNEAHRLRPGSIMREAIAECQRAQQLAEEMARVEERIEVAALANDQAQEELAARTAQEAASNDVKVQLLELKKLLDEGLISQELYDARAAQILTGKN